MTNNELPSIYQSVIPNIYYVYLHKDPETNEIIYVGKGSRGRAWHCAESNSRGEAHASWMNELILQGFTPDAWVVLVATALSEQDAFKLETELRDEYKPRFNNEGAGLCVLDTNALMTINSLRGLGMSYAKIAKEVGFSTMTVFRAYNGKTKNYAI